VFAFPLALVNAGFQARERGSRASARGAIPFQKLKHTEVQVTPPIYWQQLVDRNTSADAGAHTSPAWNIYVYYRRGTGKEAARADAVVDTATIRCTDAEIEKAYFAIAIEIKTRRHANSVCSCLSAKFQWLSQSKPSQSRHLCNKYAAPRAI
jgi:hypothetical protein